MRYLLGIDPGQVSGWAVLTVEASPKLISTGKVDFVRGLPFGNDQKMVMSCVNIMNEIHVDLPDDVVPLDEGFFNYMAIEGQYLDRSEKENVDSLIKLCRNAGRWAEAAAYHEIAVHWVPPITWITKELGKGLRRKQIEVLARQKVDALYGVVEKRSEHENAAALIGRYAALKIFGW